MSAGVAPFRVEVVAHAAALPDLRRVRDEVFVDEQGVPAELERDAARDPSCVHVLARLEDGTPIGTGRLTPDRHIGRMAVRKPWRGHGVGDALLRALLDAAWLQGTQAVHLNAQVDAIGFYARHGFVPVGERFMEAGIAHQAMARTLDGPHPIRTRTLAVEATRRIVLGARRWLWIRSHALDPGLLDAPPVLDALRAFATAGRGNQVRILLHDTAAPQRGHAPLLALAANSPFLFGHALWHETRIPLFEQAVDCGEASLCGGEAGDRGRCRHPGAPPRQLRQRLCRWRPHRALCGQPAAPPGAAADVQRRTPRTFCPPAAAQRHPLALEPAADRLRAGRPPTPAAGAARHARRPEHPRHAGQRGLLLRLCGPPGAPGPAAGVAAAFCGGAGELLPRRPPWPGRAAAVAGRPGAPGHRAAGAAAAASRG